MRSVVDNFLNRRISLPLTRVLQRAQRVFSSDMGLLKLLYLTQADEKLRDAFASLASNAISIFFRRKLETGAMITSYP